VLSGVEVVAVVETTTEVVGAVLFVVGVVVVEEDKSTAAAAAITMITTMTTAITTRLIASKLKEGLLFWGLEDTKVALKIALFRICYHARPRYRPSKLLIQVVGAKNSF